MSVLSGILTAALAIQTTSDAKQTPITLSSAISAAESHSTAVQIAQNEFAAAQARTDQNQSRRRPQVGFQAAASHFDDRTTVSFPGSNTPFELAPNNQEELALVITQDLDVSSQLTMSVSQTKLLALASAYRLQSVKEDQDLQTTTEFYEVLRAQQNVGVAKASLDANREQLAIAKRLFDGGVGQKIDTLRAESQVAQAERELVKRNNDLDSARSGLNDLIGQPLDSSLTLAEVEEGDATATPSTDDRSTLIAEALDKRPEALAASIEVKAAEKGVKIARTGNAPSVAVSLSGTRYPTTSFAQPRQDVAALTLSVSLPIFDGGLTRARVQEARQEVNTAKARQDQQRRDIALQVQNAALDVRTEQKKLDAANVALTAATAARKLAQQRFESQVGIYSEVTDAQSELTSAQAAQVEATYDLLTAKARLARALSRPLLSSAPLTNRGDR